MKSEKEIIIDFLGNAGIPPVAAGKMYNDMVAIGSNVMAIYKIAIGYKASRVVWDCLVKPEHEKESWYMLISDALNSNND